jgi:hypothetical protein
MGPFDAIFREEVFSGGHFPCNDHENSNWL